MATSKQIDELTQRRLRDAGFSPPSPDHREYDRLKAAYDERHDRFRADAAAHFARLEAIERDRRDAADARDRERLDTLTAELRAGYMATPGATEAGFRAALPELLEQARRDAATRQRDEHARHVDRARASGRYAI